MRRQIHGLTYAVMIMGFLTGMITSGWADEQKSVSRGKLTMCQEKNALLIADDPSTEWQGTELAQERGLSPKIEGVIIQGDKAKALPG